MEYRKLWIDGLEPKTVRQYIVIIIVALFLLLLSFFQLYFQGLVLIFTFFIGYSYSVYRDYKDQAYESFKQLKDLKK